MPDVLLRLRIWFVAVDRRSRGDRAASLVEYALLVGLIAIVCFAAVGFLGEETSSTYDGVGNSLTNP